MKHLDLFSGIGGFALAASWVWGADHEIVSFVEIDEFCQKVLKKHWPDAPIISDIRDVAYERILADTDTTKNDAKTETDQWRKPQLNNGPKIRDVINTSGKEPRGARNENGKDQTNPAINLLTGGFPCQPFSVAGKQRSKEDDRYLWPEMLRVIQEFCPTWIIGENVAGIINLALDQVLSDLEDSGYEIQSFIIPACAVDAPHRRDRVWIVANNDGKRQQGERIQLCGEGQEEIPEIDGPSKDVADTGSRRQPRQGQYGQSMCATQGKNRETNRPFNCSKTERSNWLPEPNVGRVAHGVPNRVDRLKSLGNAIVPQCVVPIMQAIKEIDQ